MLKRSLYPCTPEGGGGATLHSGSPHARTAFAISVRARRDAVREWVVGCVPVRARVAFTRLGTNKKAPQLDSHRVPYRTVRYRYPVPYSRSLTEDFVFLSTRRAQATTHRARRAHKLRVGTYDARWW